MEAKQNSITKFMQQQDAKFYIPVYQRNYDWKEEQCSQLLKDIFSVGKNDKIDSHFIGSIVYIQMNLITGAPELTIIDGQQRLTSLTLFIASLVKKAKENNRNDFANKLSGRFLINEDLDDDEKLKLKPIKKDDLSLKYLLGLHHSEIKEFSRVIENFNFFYENVALEEIEVAYKGFQKLIFIEIALDKNKDDPQKIFQSLNSTGLDLSQADLIRNYILMDRKPKEQLHIYEKYWVEIEKNTTEKSSKINRMSDFIRDFLTFKFSSIPNQNKVFEVFRDKFKFTTVEDLLILLEEIKLYSVFYNFFINPDEINEKTLQLNIKQIKKLQINVSYPFLLQVFRAYSDNLISLEIVNQVLEITQSFVWRRFICGVATNALNKIFMDLYKDINIEDFVNSFYEVLLRKKGSQRFPNNEEIIKELGNKDMYNINPKNRTYFLERLENYGERIYTQVDGNENVSIEHIFPRNPVKEWKEQLGVEYEPMTKLINSAPNLTLSAFNSDLSNSTFQVKRDLDGKGYKASPLRIDKILAGFDKWDLNSYTIRMKWIIDRFFFIWKYPDIIIDLDDDNLERNAMDFDFEGVSKRNIEYFLFFETKYENPTWNDLLRIVSRTMFEREPEQFLTPEIYDKLGITQNPDNSNRYIQLSNTYYINANLSAKYILRRVQLILEKFEIEDELIIKLKNNSKQ